MDESSEQPIGEYVFLRRLGWGSFGIVALYKHRLGQSPDYVAIKSIKTSSLPELPDGFCAKNHEVQHLKKSSEKYNENLVKFLDCHSVEGAEIFHIIMEFSNSGNLAQYLKEVQKLGAVQEKDIWCLAKQITNGLKTLHEMNISHRDLKPDNILLHINGIIGPVKTTDLTAIPCENIVFKIGDLGGSKSFKHTKNTTGTVAGTYHYMAPEVVTPPHSYSCKADLWSFGVIIYACLAGVNSLDELAIIQATAGVIPHTALKQYFLTLIDKVGTISGTKASAILRLTLRKLLKVNDAERIKFEDLLEIVDLISADTLPKSPVQLSAHVSGVTLDIQPTNESPAEIIHLGDTSSPESPVQLSVPVNTVTRDIELTNQSPAEIIHLSDTLLPSPSHLQVEPPISPKSINNVKPALNALVALNGLNPLKSFSGLNALKTFRGKKGLKALKEAKETAIAVLNSPLLSELDHQETCSIQVGEQQPNCLDEYEDLVRLLVVGTTEPGVAQCGLTAFGHGGSYQTRTSIQDGQTLFQGTLRVPSVGTGKWKSQMNVNLIEPFADVYIGYIVALCQAQLLDKRTLVSVINKTDGITNKVRERVNKVFQNNNMMSE